jgi:biopolymer transport protein ExbD
MTFRRAFRTPDRVEQQMTPMIDVVFQLLVFFLLSFKIAALEGDFGIRMAQAGPGTPHSGWTTPLRVRLTAGPDGELTAIRLGERKLPDFAALRSDMLAIVGTQTGPGSLAAEAEVQLVADYDLDYRHIIGAITAVSGYLDAEGRPVRLIDKVSFASR